MNLQTQPRRDVLSGSPNIIHAFVDNCVEQAVELVRSRLQMDIGFISEFIDDRLFVRQMSTKCGWSPAQVSDSIALAEEYFRKIVGGELPELIPDTAAIPKAMEILVTQGLPIGSHMGVPIRLRSGQIYGTFCCFNFRANAALDERDLQMMKVVADFVAYQIDVDLERLRDRSDKTKRIQALIQSSEEPSIVYQPMFQLSDMTLIGAEALARFKEEPQRAPDKWFMEADEVGLKTQLEIKAARSALARYRSLWKRGPLHYLGINSSPETITEGRMLEIIEGFPAEKIILEITEHDYVENYDDFSYALAPLRRRGVKIAIDDAGAGYSSMCHILNIRPDFIKLDISLTRNINSDRWRRALARALIEFGQDTDCKIIAEGVETEGEMGILRELGVHAAQGWLLGRPVPIEELWRVVI
ncbi:MAG: EAL domain-containing protein [Roseiarcus sp.]|jgi:EAL domain-containing protein (putative c-di-GMP-specific phosphodiesterase class I)|uniref:sensor domain-containing phosphodiesterase n=1 Tax=Roseiarcus sp. TaxID=1969460 RepID=UPI003C21C31E